MTNPLTQSGSIEIPAILKPTTYRQMRDDATFTRTLCFDRKALRYVPYRGKRHFVDLSPGSFNEYLRKFSPKTRNTLKRKVRRFAEQSGGVTDFRFYESPQEMTEFCNHAIAVSRVSYQEKIGFGFGETDEFRLQVMDEASKGQVCGFVLMHANQPASYVFCRIDSDVITYNTPGYDPQFVTLSPGTVLLYLLFERLFSDGRYRLFDFGGHEWDYKAFFATGHVDYIKVIWFPVTMQNVLLVTAHYVVQWAWRSAAWLKTVSNSGRDVTARYLPWPWSASDHTSRRVRSIKRATT
jgi:Acetyltransferase (GNAT) domain